MKIIAFAYACEPDMGSEPGAGWLWSRMLATFSDVWVITRSNNRGVIEARVKSLPESNRLHFVYLDLPKKFRGWKQGQRGIRLYYLLWQMYALRVARRLHRQIDFDLSWHLTIANVWLGSVGAFVGPPFIHGPVGGGVGVPWRLWKSLGTKGIIYEILRETTRFLHRLLNPLARLSWSKAQLILVNNRETGQWLPSKHREKAKVFPHATIEELASTRNDLKTNHSGQRALYVGRLLPWKGVHLAIEAMVALPDWVLTVCGDGPDQRRLKKLAVERGVQGRVRFLGWKSHPEVTRLMRECDAYVHPSLHDDAPFAVSEAISMGLPIVCLNHGGPPVIAARAGLAVRAVDSHARVVHGLAQALQETNTIRADAIHDRAVDLLFSSRAKEIEMMVAGIRGTGRVPSSG